MITTKLIPLDQIATDAGTQIRARIDEEVVANYAEAIEAGDTFPNVVTFHDGVEWFLADGFHRFFAYKRLNRETIRAEVHSGTRADALKYALSANASHGLRRTNADKRRSVEIALKEWPKLSDREIARICAVGNDLVGDVRRNQLPDSGSCGNQLSDSDSCGNQLSDSDSSKTQLSDSDSSTRIGADGKERRLPKKAKETPESSQETPNPSPAPATPATADAAWSAALGGVEPRVTEYYSRMEALVNDALENATDKQLISMSVYAATVCALIKAELRERQQRRKKEGSK